jgi:hypothetical protein
MWIPYEELIFTQMSQLGNENDTQYTQTPSGSHLFRARWLSGRYHTVGLEISVGGVGRVCLWQSVRVMNPYMDLWKENEQRCPLTEKGGTFVTFFLESGLNITVYVRWKSLKLFLLSAFICCSQTNPSLSNSLLFSISHATLFQMKIHLSPVSNATQRLNVPWMSWGGNENSMDSR